MAKMDYEMPEALMNKLEELVDDGVDNMFSEMADEAGKILYFAIKENIRKSFKNPDIFLRRCVITKVYTSDKGDPIEEAKCVKISFLGYIPGSPKTKRHPKGTPVSLAAAAREYGTSTEAKRPFMRVAVSGSAGKRAVEEMKKIQEKYFPED